MGGALPVVFSQAYFGDSDWPTARRLREPFPMLANASVSFPLHSAGVVCVLVCLCTCMHASVCVCLLVCVRVFVSIRARVCKYTCLSLCVLSVWVCGCVRFCLCYVFIYPCMLCLRRVYIFV